MTEQANIRIGQHVIFHAPDTTVHDALVTAVHSDKCINLVLVPFTGATQKDSNGVVPVTMTSVLHESAAGPGSGCWWKPEIVTKREVLFPGGNGDGKTDEPEAQAEQPESSGAEGSPQ